MNSSLCTQRKTFLPFSQTKKSKIFEKFFSKFEKNVLLLHYSERSNLSPSREQSKTYLKIADKARFWLTKVDCYLEAIPLLLKNGAYTQALLLLDQALAETKRNDYSMQKEICYSLQKKLKKLQKEFFDRGQYELLSDALSIESDAIVHYEPEKANKLLDLADQCKYLENEKWAILKEISIALGENALRELDSIRLTGDFSYFLDYAKKSKDSPKQKTIEMIASHAYSLQKMRESIEAFVSRLS